MGSSAPHRSGGDRAHASARLVAVKDLVRLPILSGLPTTATCSIFHVINLLYLSRPVPASPHPSDPGEPVAFLLRSWPVPRLDAPSTLAICVGLGSGVLAAGVS